MTLSADALQGLRPTVRKLVEAQPEFEFAEAVPGAGVLLALFDDEIPILIAPDAD